MNRIYRLCWNAATSQWVAASELARGGRPAVRNGAPDRAPRATAIALALALALGATDPAHAGQTGGQIVSGHGEIRRDGAVTTIDQSSQRLSLNWQTFDVGANETVNFVQPGRDAIAVNRILGNSASEIYGHLNANGQVWLINPNGVLFGEGSQVNVGGLVASTLDTPDASMNSDLRRFSGTGKGSVVNKGNLRAARGGYVALLGNTVSNQGTVSAQLGTVAMGGGSAVTLTFDGSRLMHLQVERSTLDNLVENRQLIQADGGRVFMTAGAADSLLASAVNNTGLVRAQTVENRNGEIVLLAGMQAGHVDVEGKLDASAPNGGDGGRIETSGAFAHIGAAAITAAAPKGKAGTWLVDPYDLTIDATAANTISSTLDGGTNVTEQTTSTGASGEGVQNAAGVGDINVNAPITWTNAAATLTLDAYRAVNVNSAIDGAGGVVIHANGNGGNGDITLGSGATIAGGTGVTLTAADRFINNAGASALASSAGQWLVYSADPSNDTRGGLTPQFVQYAAAAGATPLGTGNGFLYALAPTVAITGLTGTVEKTYDGGTGATLVDANFTRSGLVNGDTMVAVAGTYAGKDAANGIAVTAPTASSAYAFTDASGTVPVYGYTVTGLGQSANIGVIDPRQLGIAIVNNPTKTYNGTKTATLTASNYLTSGLVAGESITFSQPNSVAYDSANAGAINVTANFVPSNFIAANGTKVANYTLPTVATGIGTINPAKVQLSGLIGTDKTYDGTTADALDISRASIFGVISGDTADATLDTSAGAGVFVNANVGSGKSVAATGFQLVGNKASNYELLLPSDITASITRKALTVQGVSAVGKVYDATTAATLATAANGVTLSGVIGSDDVSLGSTGATGTFVTKNAGDGIAVTVSGYSLTGGGTGNYTLVQPTGLTASITPRHLDLSIVGNPTRIYNGTDTANLAEGNVQIVGLQGSDAATVKQASSASYDSVNAGARTVTALLEASDFTLGTGTALSNYSFDSRVVGAGTIAQASLTWTIVGNPSRQYDGTTNATLDTSNYRAYGFVAGEGAAVTQTVGTYSDKNVGTRGVTTNVASSDFSANAGTSLSNYILPTTISGYGNITPRDLGTVSVIISGHPTKSYDGTLAATLIAGSQSSSGDYTITVNDSSKAFASGEGVYITKTAGTYASKNAGQQPVTVSLAQSDYTPYGGTDLSNYTPLPTSAFGTGEITPALLTAAIVNNPTKVYNGTTYMTLAAGDYAISGFASGEGAQIVPSKRITFDTKDVGSGKTITAQMATTSYLANDGTDLSNYTLATTAQGPGTITAAPLYVVGVSAQDKTYDTTTAASLNSGGASLVGLVSTDADKVTLTRGTTGSFADGDAGTGKTVTPIGFAISGSEAGNYVLQPLASLTANINPYTLTITGVSAINRFYDATTAIGLNTGNAALHDVFSSDAADVQLDASAASGSVRSANALTGQAVTTTGFALTGNRAANYRVTQVDGLTADIAKRPITATITGNPTKPYDGSTSVTLLASDYTLTGFVGNQGATAPQSSTAAYNSANAGSNVGLQSTLSVSDFVAGTGTNLANYALPTTATGTLGTITPFIINLMGTRVYDATVHADASLFTSTSGTVAGVNNERLTLTGSGNLVTKNVGSQRAFQDFGTLALGDSSGTASNYALAGGIDWVTITPATLTVVNTVAADKVYDRTTTAQLSGATLSGVLGSDDVTLGNTATGNFSSNTAGSHNVTTAMTISGGDLGNYTLVQPSAISVTITPKMIAPSATALDKWYDGNTYATASVSSADVISGDTVVLTSTSRQFDGKDAANGRTVTVGGIAIGGADAGNYALTTNTTTTTANIVPTIVTLTGTRVYDTTATAAAGTLTMGNVVSGETLALSGSANLGSKKIGTYKDGGSFDLGTLTLGDSSSALASNYTLVGGVDRYTVTPAALTISGTLANDKSYDGTRAATVYGSVLNGVLGSDAVTMTNTAAGTFDTKNVGTNKRVTTAIGITGNDASNYTLTQPTNVRAAVTSKSITVAARGVNKVYDGGTASAATLYSSDVASGDNVVFSAGTNVFDTKDVGTGKTVSLASISASGTDAANYTLGNTSTTTLANITPFIINLSASRIYDSTRTATASLFGNSGVVSGANGETLTLSGAGTAGSKNVGTYRRATDGSGNFDLGSLALTGNGTASAGNYALSGGADALTITPYALTVAAAGIDKTYDAGKVASVNLSPTNLFAGDTVSLAYAQARFGDKNAASNKSVAVTGIAVSGTDAGNYTWNATATTTATITPKSITGSILADDRTYDTTSAATTHGTLAGVIAGDSLAYTSTTGSFADKTAADHKTVTVSGVLGGSDLNNYTVTANGTTTASIAKATIGVTTTALNKVYDGAATASTTLARTGVLGNDVVTLSSTNAAFSDANAANGKTVTTSGIAASGADAGNYVWNTTATTTANITPYVISLHGSRTYNGSATAAADALASNSQVAGIVGDTLTLSGATSVADKTVGTQKSLTGLGTLALQGNGNTLASNYTLVGGNHWLTITPKQIVVDATGSTKVYDTNALATAALSSTGIVGNDQVVFAGGSTRYDSKNVGTGKTITVADIVASGSDATNYVINTTASTLGDITPYMISLSGSRIYDSTSTAAASLFGNSGVVAGANGETLTLSGAATTGSKNVGSYSRATDGSGNFGLGTLALTGNGTASASNYALRGGTDALTITPFALTVAATGIDKIYDAGSVASVNLSPTNLFAGDAVNLAYGQAAFGDKNAASQKHVSVSGIAVSGTDAGNYTWNTNAGTTATITPKSITGRILADDRTYDTTSAVATHGTLAGVIAGDDLSYTSTTGSFTDKTAADHKTVTVSGVLGGTDLNNYTVAANGTTTASIAKAAMHVTTAASDKVYDGGANAVTTLARTGVLGNDVVTLSSTNAAFSDVNAANGKTVTTSGITAGGVDAGNYLWNTTATTTANITPYVISLHGSRTYNASATAAADALVSNSQVDGIVGDTLTLSGATSVADKTVGTQKSLTGLGTLALQGNGNALASNYTLIGGNHWLTITPKQIVVDATGSTKVYDANALATAALSSNGIVGNDQVVFAGGSTRYDSKNVGTGKTITVVDIAASGSDATNYAFNTTALTAGDITPLVITGVIGADSKTYDGTTAARTQGVLSGVLSGDVVGVSTQGEFVDKNAGNGKTVAVNSQLTGVDAGNYQLSTSATTTADIRKVVLDLAGTRVYDGTSVAGATMFGNQGVVDGIAGESLTLSGSGVLASRHVADRRTLAGLDTLVLNGNGTTLADNYTLLGGHDVATVTPLGIAATIGADDKTYDGGTSAATHGTLSGVVAGDDVALTTSGAFGDKNVATGKTVNVTGRIGGADAGDYVLAFNPATTAAITARRATVSAQGTDKFFDGNRNDVVRLTADGVLPGDVVTFAAGSALFADSTVGLGKAVSVGGIAVSGADGGNYAFNPTAETTASINQNASQGASATTLTQVDAVLRPDSVATPYGVASNLTVGQYTGNHKKSRRSLEKNVQRADFIPGLSLQVVDGGVRPPADAMH